MSLFYFPPSTPVYTAFSGSSTRWLCHPLLQSFRNVVFLLASKHSHFCLKSWNSLPGQTLAHLPGFLPVLTQHLSQKRVSVLSVTCNTEQEAPGRRHGLWKPTELVPNTHSFTDELSDFIFLTWKMETLFSLGVTVDTQRRVAVTVINCFPQLF